MNDNISKISQLNDKIFRFLAYQFFICQYRHRRFKLDCIRDVGLNDCVSKSINSVIDTLNALRIYDDEPSIDNGSPIDYESINNSISHAVNESFYRMFGGLSCLDNMSEMLRDDIRGLQIYYAVKYTKELPQEFISNIIVDSYSIEYIYKYVNCSDLKLINEVSSKYGLFICDLTRSIFNNFTKINNITSHELCHCFYPYPEPKNLLDKTDDINEFFTSKIKFSRYQQSLYKMIEQCYNNEDISIKNMKDFNLEKNEIPTYIQILEMMTLTKFHVDSIINRKYGLLIWDNFRFPNSKSKNIEEYINYLYTYHINTYKNDKKDYIDFRRQCFKWLENADKCIKHGSIIPIK